MIKRRSAGLVVVRRCEGRFDALLLRAYCNWDFPKGLIEPGEDALSAAIRETREETDLADLAFPWGLDFVETEPYARGKVARFYLAESTGGAPRLLMNPLLGRPEHHEFRWMPLENASALLAPRLCRVLGWAKQKLESSPSGGELTLQAYQRPNR